MLVISRTPDRADSGHNAVVLYLLDGREVRVSVCRGPASRKVQLCIDAPADVSVLRAELLGQSDGE